MLTSVNTTHVLPSLSGVLCLQTQKKVPKALLCLLLKPISFFDQDGDMTIQFSFSFALAAMTFSLSHSVLNNLKTILIIISLGEKSKNNGHDPDNKNMELASLRSSKNYQYMWLKKAE